MMSNRYTCSICQETHYDQLTFFGHLKAHYEFPGNSTQQQQQQESPFIKSISQDDINSIDEGQSVRIVPAVETRRDSPEESKGVFTLEHEGDDEGRLIGSVQSIFDRVIELKMNPEGHRDHHEGPSNGHGRKKTYETHVECQKPKGTKTTTTVGSPDEEEAKNDGVPLDHPEGSVPQKKEIPKKTLKLPSRNKKVETFKCSECSRIFHHKNSLTYHMRGHTGERPFQCDICGKRFLASSALKVHMRLHSGEKPYKCKHCDRAFRQWGDLKYHVISIHSDVRKYQCEFCGIGFSRKYSLTVHRRIHTGERDYKCEFCGKGFRAASYLQNHRRIHTGEKPHNCPVCKKPFRVRSDMKRHVESHNRDQRGHREPTSRTRSRNKPSRKPAVSASASSSSGEQRSQELINETSSSASTIEVPVTTAEIIVGQGGITIAEGTDNQVCIIGDIITEEGTPINIVTLQDGRLPEGSPLSGDASIAALLQREASESAEIPSGIIYQNRDGQVEVVALIYEKVQLELLSSSGLSS